MDIIKFFGEMQLTEMNKNSIKMKAKLPQSCPTLCDLMDYTVHGILQTRILEWVAIPFSGDILNPGIKPRSPALQADFLLSEPAGKSTVL